MYQRFQAWSQGPKGLDFNTSGFVSLDPDICKGAKLKLAVRDGPDTGKRLRKLLLADFIDLFSQYLLFDNPGSWPS